MLIYYERPDISGPKLSTYSMVKLDQQQRDEMINILTLSNGILGAVKKTRHLYMVKQTRIHIDKVSDLGNFMELEVQIVHKLNFCTMHHSNNLNYTVTGCSR